MIRRICIVSLCVIIACFSVAAQDGSKRLAIGVELLSTTGFGLELATPLHSKLNLRGGISMLPLPSFEISRIIELDQNMRSNLQQAFDLPQVQAALTPPLPNSVDKINTEIDLSAKLGLFNGKILLDFYPMESSGFHLTGGFYIGKKKLVNVEGTMREANVILDMLTVVRDESQKLGQNHDYINHPLIEGHDLTVGDLGKGIDAALSINTIKPYIGLGFGRTVPRRFFGASFELGAIFQGAPKITSDDQKIQKLIDDELGGITDILKKFSIYPVLSLKLHFGVF